MQHWYLVQTKAKQEKLAQENLQRQDYTTYLPLFQKPKRLQGRWQEKEEPLFPGYLFVQLNKHQQDISPIRSTIGVLKLVRFGTELQPVPEDIIHEIRQRLAQSESQTAKLPFKKGEPVRITEGSFKGMTAIFETDSGKKRVELLLDLLGRQHRINVSRDDISPLE